jgi:hypothetical protein
MQEQYSGWVMKDKNYEGLANRLLRNGKVVPVATAVIFSVLSPGLVIAEPGIVENPAGQDIILENSVSENLAPDSQPLNLDALTSAPAAELSAVDEPAADSSAAPTKLALAEQVLPNGSGMTGMVKEPGAINTGSTTSTGDESPQKPYALILALVALISLVPMSRRHH